MNGFTPFYFERLKNEKYFVSNMLGEAGRLSMKSRPLILPLPVLVDPNFEVEGLLSMVRSSKNPQFLLFQRSIEEFIKAFVDHG